LRQRYEAFGKGLRLRSALRGAALSDRSNYRNGLIRLLGPSLLHGRRLAGSVAGASEPAVAADEHGPGLDEFHSALRDLASGVAELRARAERERDQ
jgi:hypothetical protein